VSATDPDDEPYDWSNRGRWAAIAAPGCHVSTKRDSTYGELCGTSSAAPAVAGLVGLARSLSPTATAKHIYEAVTSTGLPTLDVASRGGRISAPGLLMAATMNVDETAPPFVEGSPSAPLDVRAVAMDSAVRLSWGSPQAVGGGITGYVITISPGDETRLVDGDVRSFVASGLINGLTYRFTVAAENGSGVGAPSAQTEPATPSGRGVSRVAGPGRVATAVAVSQRAFTSAASVVIARADVYVDALTAAPLAAVVGGPLLLSGSTGALEPEVGAEIRRLGAHSVQLIGGTGGLSDQLERSLAWWGVTQVTRIAGTDRFDTARRIAARIGGRAVYVTNGVTGWPDAIAASSLASLQGRPMLLVSADGVPPATAAAMRDLQVESAVVVGGTSLVAPSTLAQLKAASHAPEVTVTRVAGSDRYETSRLVADLAIQAGADASRVWLASGQLWPDALAAGPAVAAHGGVLLLIRGDDLDNSPSAAHWLGEHASNLEEVVIVGGGASIAAHVETQVLERLARI
jgi:lactocepin